MYGGRGCLEGAGVFVQKPRVLTVAEAFHGVALGLEAGVKLQELSV